MKTCPKCGGTAQKTRESSPHLAHGAHATLHFYKHGHPILAAVGGVITGLQLLLGHGHYRCGRCGHQF